MKIMLLIPIVFMFGCISEQEELERKKVLTEHHPVILIDNCEYIAWGGSHGEVGITHKGNCSNSIHIYNKKGNNK